jgi:hypothetical protein
LRAQQLAFHFLGCFIQMIISNQIVEACGWEQASRYLIRDRNGAYGEVFVRKLRSMGIRDRPTSPRSP